MSVAADPSDAPLTEGGRTTRARVLLGLVRPVFRRHWLRLVLGFVALITVDFLQLTIPRFVKTAVDALGAGTATQPLLLHVSGAICLVAVVVAVLRFVWRYLIIGFSRILEKSLRDRLFNHVLRMDQPFFERWTTGDLMAHSSNDLSVIQMACGMGLVAAVDALVMSTAAVGFMLAISVKLTLIALLPMPLLIVCTRVLSGRLHHRFNLVQEQFSLLTEFARATLVAIRLIKAYTLERFQEDRFRALGEQYVHSNLRVAAVQGLLFPISTLVGNAGMLLLLYYGGIEVIEGRISIGSFVAFVSYLYMLIWPMMAIGWVANLVQRGLTSLARIHRLLVEQPMTVHTPTLALPQAATVYRCRDLTFTYPAGSRPALAKLSAWTSNRACSASPAVPARASRPCANCCCACTRWRTTPFSFAAWTSTGWTRHNCAPPWPMSARNRYSLPAPLPTTSPSADRTRPGPRSRRRLGPRPSMRKSKASPAATRR